MGEGEGGWVGFPYHPLLATLLAMPRRGGALGAAMKVMEVLLHVFLRRCVLMGCLGFCDLLMQVFEEALQRVGRESP